MSDKCRLLHQYFNGMEKLSFPFANKDIPQNGIYILFEKGEHAHDTDRIVRVGTHTGENQLRSRLRQHFLKENKDRSIFRKNIGRALLNKKDDPFLEHWELDLTTRKAKEKYNFSIDHDKQKEIENEVTKYIQNNFSFVVFPVVEKDKRLEIEQKLISTISLCSECAPSEDWFGHYSPKKKIRESGMWLVNGLYKEPMSEKDMEWLMELLKISKN
ncbi:hypothetical protein [Methanococcoides sp. LMO-2]|uniref:GIY-YIG domain-containing protein n=1 Tax=Methanococcoides cohabitans TaxID=3136559 RepID=A0ABU9KPP5_9EURY